MEQVYAGPPLSRLLDLSADAVAAVQAGQSLTEILAKVPARERPGVQALTFHVMRHLGTARAVRSLLAPKNPPPRVDALLLCALALLGPAEAAPYAAHTLVDQAVKAARQRTPAAANFVNAVLRRFLREQAALSAQVAAQPEALWNHPAWWVARLRQDWPDNWQAVLKANQAHPPMTLRVNARQGSRADYLVRLAEAGIAAHALAGVRQSGGLGGSGDPNGSSLSDQAVRLDAPVGVQRLPGFEDGACSVQDAAAQAAAPLLLGPGPTASRLVPGARVLDACAAPGGKTAHLLECADLDLVALDSDAQRLARVGQTLARLRLGPAQLLHGDAAAPASWWDGRPFDAILLDAPCSAAGIVRRHPDIRWLRRSTDIAALGALQARMLDALWPLLKPGGRLLYATCSVFKAEGQDQTDAFLQRLGGDSARWDPASPGHLLPLHDNPPQSDDAADVAAVDGFYYALMHKN